MNSLSVAVKKLCAREPLDSCRFASIYMAVQVLEAAGLPEDLPWEVRLAWPHLGDPPLFTDSKDMAVSIRLKTPILECVTLTFLPRKDTFQGTIAGIGYPDLDPFDEADMAGWVSVVLTYIPTYMQRQNWEIKPDPDADLDQHLASL